MIRFEVVILVTAYLGAACAPTSATEASLTAASVAQWADSRAYQAGIVASLVKSGTARDLALAATGSQMLDVGSAIAQTGDEAPDDAEELFRMAAAAAGDDVLVHWIVATGSGRGDLQRSSIAALLRLEPANGMAWLQRLNAAARSTDEKGIADALKKLSEADLYTTHLRDLVVAWLDASERFPPARPLGPHTDLPESETDRRIGTAIMFAYAANTPDSRGLMSECSQDRSSTRPGRRELCLAIGRKMVSSQDRLPRVLGFAVLRRLQAQEATEVARTIAWTTAALDRAIISLTGNHRFSTVIEDAWRQAGGEIEFEENLLLRAGVPLVPPAGWDPPKR